MKRKSIIAVLLAVILCAAMIPACFADAAFEADQYYEFDACKDCPEVYSIAVSAGNDINGAENVRDKMMKAGYDSFIVHNGYMYYILCGKFTNMEEALHYLELILEKTDESDAYITEIHLPEEAIQAFDEAFESPYPYEDECRHMGYQRSQHYKFNKTDKAVYSVQIAEGKNIEGAYDLCKEMYDAGYDAFVYDLKDEEYAVMCGKFAKEEDALKYLASISENTDIRDAYLTSATVPYCALHRFDKIYFGE